MEEPRKGDKKKTKLKKEKREKEVIDDADSDSDSDVKSSKKRKRDILPDELEIDVNLPEPVSRKEARKAKKAKVNPKPATNDAKSKSELNEGDNQVAKRSDYGVWIGNLPWSATKETLRTFLIENSDITTEQITRVHMPAPSKPPNPNWTTKPLNKGFAYVDFSVEIAMYTAIALTETKMDGRPLLIKNAKSFEGRPQKPKTEEAGEGDKALKSKNPPNKRIFVGNLSFDVTKEDLRTHFEQCGEIADLHMATFEDSGKCKGYAWVTFETEEASTSAVKGFIFKEEKTKKKKKESVDSSDEEVNEKKSKNRKWFVNKLMGRELRCEFAEDSTTRYNKRFGKEKQAEEEGVHPDRAAKNFGSEARPNERPQRQFREQRPRGKVDPRNIKSGKAHTSAPRASYAIAESKGTKTTFE